MIYLYIDINLYIGLEFEHTAMFTLVSSLQTTYPHAAKIFIRCSVLTHSESWPTRKRHRVIVYFVRGIGVNKSLDRPLPSIYLYLSVHLSMEHMERYLSVGGHEDMRIWYHIPRKSEEICKSNKQTTSLVVLSVSIVGDQLGHALP